MRRCSPRRPSGRSKITATISAPIMKRRKLGSDSMPGRDCVPVQIPHTTNAPRIAPLLLAEPPTISMAQMTNVASSGSNVSGERKRMW